MSETTSVPSSTVAGAATADVAMLSTKEQIEVELRASIKQELEEARSALAHDRDALHAAVQAAVEVLDHKRIEAEAAIQRAYEEAAAQLRALGHAQEVEARQQLVDVHTQHEAVLTGLVGRVQQLGDNGQAAPSAPQEHAPGQSVDPDVKAIKKALDRLKRWFFTI